MFLSQQPVLLPVTSITRSITLGCNQPDISRILKNERYAGNWTWRMSKTVRDPLTGKKKKYLRPVKEHLPFFRENLIIIDKITWDNAQERWKDLAGSWPVSKKRKSFYKQKSYVHTSPTHLFSGLMRCSLCGGVIALISGKSSENDNYFLYDGLDKDFRPYYVAHTNIETLALLDKAHQGSNWKHWWAGKDSVPSVCSASPAAELHFRSTPRPKNYSYRRNS